MHTWYCPGCGSEYELRECAVGRVFGLRARLHCPDCQRPVRVSGPALLVATLLICLFAGFFFDWLLLPPVFVLGTALSVLRIIQQIRARNRRGVSNDPPPG